MPQQVNIPSSNRAIGQQIYGPVALDAEDSNIIVNIDRSVNQGLNSKPATTMITMRFEVQLPGDANWYEQGTATLDGGVHNGDPEVGPINTDTFSVSLMQPGVAGRSIRLVSTVAGSTVRVAGSIISE